MTRFMRTWAFFEDKIAVAFGVSVDRCCDQYPKYSVTVGAHSLFAASKYHMLTAQTLISENIM